MHVPHAPEVAARSLADRSRLTLLASLGLMAICAGPVLAQTTWTAPGAGNWFDPGNWSLGVPTAGSGAFINNGGTAELSLITSGGATETPILSALNLGTSFAAAAAAPVSGFVSSTGVALRATASSFGLTVGLASGTAAASTTGGLTVTGAGSEASSVLAGSMFFQAAATAARGEILVDGAFTIGTPTAGGLTLGQLFQSARGSDAHASLRAGSLSGAVDGAVSGAGFLIVGNITSGVADDIGNRSFAELVAPGAGVLSVSNASMIVGTTFGSARATDAAGTVHVNRADGVVKTGSTLALPTDAPTLWVGVTTDGEVRGTVEAAGLSLGAGQRIADLRIGTSGAAGNAQGSVRFGTGDLRVGSAQVGVANNGVARGELVLDGGGLFSPFPAGFASVGRATASNGQLVQAAGTVQASGGLDGFTSYNVGMLTGSAAAGSFADGTLIANGSIVPGAVPPASAVNVGLLLGASDLLQGAARATGTMRVGGPLAVDGFIQVGQMFGAAAGSLADGRLHVAGNAGTVRDFWIVGNVNGTALAQVGSESRGEMQLTGGGSLTSTAETYIGTTVGNSRVTDAAGTRINQATGTVLIDGTLHMPADISFFLVGITQGGMADGRFTAGALDMPGSRAHHQSPDRYRDRRTGDGALRGRRRHAACRHGADRQCRRRRQRRRHAEARRYVDGGRQRRGRRLAAARPVLELIDTLASVDEDFTLTTGTLALQRSLLAVGDAFSLGAGSTLRLGIGGLARGIEFGAVDALWAFLDGALELDFSDLAFGASSMVFDLVHGIDGLEGDFTSLSFLGLDAGYGASTGIFDVGDGGIYRLTLTRLDVPEPASPVLVLLALAVLGVARRRLTRPR